MPSFRTGTVTEVVSERAGLQVVSVDGEPAYVLTGLIGPVAVGDRVVVNTTAVDLGLGTGGRHFVHWNLARDEWSSPGPGHIMKLRYTSLQADTGSVEELDARMAEADDCEGVPVVVCPLHSHLAPVALAFESAAPGRRLVFVMTDSAALPLALSDLVASLSDSDLLAATITAGQAFGGDHEAVNLHSALVAARRVCGADAVVVAPGPGVVGTASRLGFSPLEVAPALDAVEAVGGRPIAVVRASDADPRPRHQGVSHHSVTALSRARARATVAVPAGERGARLRRDLEDEGVADRHRIMEVAACDVGSAAAARGIGLRSMGRGMADDPVMFEAAAAAGTLAALWAGGGPDGVVVPT